MLVDKLLQAIKNSQKRVIDKSVADKMTSMMLGTFTNGTGISSSPADYVMAGKLVQLKQFSILNIQVTSG